MLSNLKTTLFGQDIDKLLDKGTSLIEGFSIEKLTISTLDGESGTNEEIVIKNERLHAFNITKKFLIDYTDYISITFDIDAKTLVNNLLPFRNMLVCSLYFICPDEGGILTDNIWKFRGYIMGIGNTDTTDRNINSLREEDLDKVGFIKVDLQLVYEDYEILNRSLPDIRMENAKMKEIVGGFLAKFMTAYEPKIYGDTYKYQLSFKEPDITKTYTITRTDLIEDEIDIVYPPLMESIRRLDNKFGIYYTGCCVYFTRNLSKEDVNSNDRLFDFRKAPEGEAYLKSGELIISNGLHKIDDSIMMPIPYDAPLTTSSIKDDLLSNTNITSAKHICIYVSGESVGLDASNKTYYTNGKRLEILVRSDTEGSNPAVVSFMQHGSNVATFSAKNLVNRSNVKSDDGKMVANNAENVKELSMEPIERKSSFWDQWGSVGSMASGKVTETIVSDQGASNREFAKNYLSTCLTMVLKWRGGNPFIIKPYDVVEVKVAARDNIICYTGNITTVIFAWDKATDSCGCNLEFKGKANQILPMHPDEKGKKS